MIGMCRLLLAGLVLLAAGSALFAQTTGAESAALADLRTRAEKGDARAQNELGAAFEEGLPGVAKNAAAAAAWYRRAAEQNDARAQCNLGRCYEEGVGVKQDGEEAEKWYRKAVEQIDAEAKFRLSNWYHNSSLT